MTLRVIKETKPYGRTHAHTHGRENSIPTTNKVCGGYNNQNVFPNTLTPPGPEVIKLFSYSTHLSTKFILLINVKMPTVVGILTFISRINTISEGFKAIKIVIYHHFTFYEHLKFYAQLSRAQKKVYNLGARSCERCQNPWASLSFFSHLRQELRNVDT